MSNILDVSEHSLAAGTLPDPLFCAGTPAWESAGVAASPCGGQRPPRARTVDFRTHEWERDRGRQPTVGKDTPTPREGRPRRERWLHLFPRRGSKAPWDRGWGVREGVKPFKRGSVAESSTFFTATLPPGEQRRDPST